MTLIERLKELDFILMKVQELEIRMPALCKLEKVLPEIIQTLERQEQTRQKYIETVVALSQSLARKDKLLAESRKLFGMVMLDSNDVYNIGDLACRIGTFLTELDKIAALEEEGKE